MIIDNDSIIPKYYQIKEYLLKYFKEKDLKDNEKIPSENELINIFKVSRNTVRQALDMLEREGIVYKEQGKGTFFSKSRLKKNFIIGFISPASSKYIYIDIINGIEEYCHKNKYSIILSNSNANPEKEKEALDSMIEKGIDGLIIEPALSYNITKDSYIFKKLTDLEIPILVIDVLIQGLNLPTLTLDDIKCGYEATEYLLKKNHNKIGFIYKKEVVASEYRLKGYLDALHDYGIKINESYISGFYEQDEIKNNDIAGICTRKLLELDYPPTAIFYYNDESAIPGIKTIINCGLRIPDDISVLGFDDSEYAEFSNIPLTTFMHPKKNMGVQAAKMIIDEIQSPGTLKKQIYYIDTKIVERKSVKALVSAKD
jgi:GntR family transcriptional regulator, arabinose operon transcriptional repressor